MDYITSRAMAYDYPVIKALAIASAESNFNIDAKNPDSTASGLFQFLDGSFQYYCVDKYHLADSLKEKSDSHVVVECAMLVLEEPNGDSNWAASRPVWSKELSDAD